MRYDKVIYLISKGTEVYNELTGNYDTVGEVSAYEKHAHVSDSGTQSMNMLYGKIREGAKIFRLKGSVDVDFDYLRYDNELYDLTLRRNINDGVILHAVKRQ